MVFSIVTVMSGIAFPFYLNKTSQTNLKSSTEHLRDTVLLLQQRAYAGDRNTDYGIFFESDKYTTFQGIAFVTGTERSQTLLSSEIGISLINFNNGGSEIIFQKGKVSPSTHGSFRMSNGTSTYAIEINREGLVSINKL